MSYRPFSIAPGVKYIQLPPPMSTEQAIQLYTTILGASNLSAADCRLRDELVKRLTHDCAIVRVDYTEDAQ